MLFVGDLERSRTFYQQTLAMTVRHEDDSSTALATDNGMLLLLNEAGAKDLLGDGAVAKCAKGGASFVIVAQVDDVDATYRELAARGVEFLRAPKNR